MSFEAKDYSISDILNKTVFDIPRTSVDMFGENLAGKTFLKMYCFQFHGKIVCRKKGVRKEHSAFS